MTEIPARQSEGCKPSKSGLYVTQMRLLVALLTLASLWIARSFLLELAWAVTLAVALWPLYRRAAKDRGRKLILIPLGFTLATGLVVMVPIAMVAVEVVRDSDAALQWLNQAQSAGIPTPLWLDQLPVVGPSFASWWQSHLADPSGAAALLGGFETRSAADWTRALAAQVVSRSWFFVVTLLALFIILRNGEHLAEYAMGAARRFYGEFGERFLGQAGEAIRAAVNGTVFVAIGEGALIGIGYAVTGVTRPILFTVATICFALLPLGAWAAFGAAALLLVVQGHVAAGIGLCLFGAVVMLTGDNLVQPALIGNSIELPFLWTFIGVFGGLETFGIVGLFLGPAVMAALFLAWKEWLGLGHPHSRRWRLRHTLSRRRDESRAKTGERAPAR